MSRSSPDLYTRFTSTSPHASSKPPPSSSSTSRASPSFGSSYQPSTAPSSKPSPSPPGPPKETPQEKVARLRAASRLAKSRASLSPLDRIIARGRRVADSTHRVFAYGLIGFSGVAALLSIYALTDLVLHNRRQKRAWIDRELQRLHDAQKAFVRGDASPEQLHLLQQERAGEEMVEKRRREGERKKRESWWGRGKALLGLGQKEGAGEEDDEGRYGRVESKTTDAETVEVLPGKRLLEEERWVVDNNQHKDQSVSQAVKDMVEDKRRSAEKELDNIAPATLGGPLDVLAGNLTGAVKTKTSTGTTGWLGWGRGRGKDEP